MFCPHRGCGIFLLKFNIHQISIHYLKSVDNCWIFILLLQSFHIVLRFSSITYNRIAIKSFLTGRWQIYQTFLWSYFCIYHIKIAWFLIFINSFLFFFLALFLQWFYNSICKWTPTKYFECFLRVLNYFDIVLFENHVELKPH